MLTIAVDNHEELKAVNELLAKMREERKRELAMSKARAEFEMAVSNLIMTVGIEDAKHILRETNHNLRDPDPEYLF